MQVPAIVEWSPLSQTHVTVSPALMFTVPGSKTVPNPNPTWTVTVAADATGAAARTAATARTARERFIISPSTMGRTRP